jgi:glycosyltransferase involved in cell wall biosynthesis
LFVARVLIVNNTSVYVHRFRRELIRRIKSEGHEVVLVCPDDEYTPSLSDLGVERVCWPLRQHGTDPWSEYRAARFLAAEAKRRRPDVVLNYTIKPAVYGSMAARASRAGACYSVFTGLGYYFTDPARIDSTSTRAIRFLLRRALRHDNAVYFQNESDRALFLQLQLVDEGKTRIVDGSGVDTMRFQPGGGPVQAQSFLLIGRMLPEKGIREFVQAAKMVRAAHPSARFRLAGGIDTSSSAIARAEIERWQADGVVEYLGELADIRPAVEAASVVVLPSYREGMPRSVLEGMAMGKAIIATDVPGCRDCVTDGVNGLLVKPMDAESLADAMARMLVETSLAERMGAMSRRIAVDRFDVHRINERFLRECGLVR